VAESGTVTRLWPSADVIGSWRFRQFAAVPRAGEDSSAAGWTMDGQLTERDGGFPGFNRMLNRDGVEAGSPGCQAGRPAAGPRTRWGFVPLALTTLSSKVLGMASNFASWSGWGTGWRPVSKASCCPLGDQVTWLEKIPGASWSTARSFEPSRFTDRIVTETGRC